MWLSLAEGLCNVDALSFECGNIREDADMKGIGQIPIVKAIRCR